MQRIDTLIHLIEDAPEDEIYIFDNARYHAYYELFCEYEYSNTDQQEKMGTTLKHYWVDYIEQVMVVSDANNKMLKKNCTSDDRNVLNQVLERYNTLIHGKFFKNNSDQINTVYLNLLIENIHQWLRQHADDNSVTPSDVTNNKPINTRQSQHSIFFNKAVTSQEDSQDKKQRVSNEAQQITQNQGQNQPKGLFSISHIVDLNVNTTSYNTPRKT